MEEKGTSGSYKFAEVGSISVGISKEDRAQAFQHFEKEEACLDNSQGMRGGDLVEERDGRINLDILTGRFRCRKNGVG
ncbi:hypothetical protein E6C27_scaffold403G00250 [Cucumis melo var. makuwa]|uniref:Uncharacterized protein n=1 Tax=Cucumis melo var. makuwa TaxID=1194695 RepID=A0A5A7SYR7_CUCMM|nr:hypothetical protein E6C27_scaffold403G00250 [Cucumis melo var. makuwa]